MKKIRLSVIGLLLLVWIVDFIDQRFFFYFYDKQTYYALGMELHFTVAWRYLISIFKWLLVFALFPDFFGDKKQLILKIFAGLLLTDILTILLIKYHILNLVPLHNLLFSILRLKVMNNYFMVTIAGLFLIRHLIKISHENQTESNLS